MNKLLKPLAAAALAACALAAQADTELGPYAPVTDARLANPEPANWLQYRGNYAGWGYSPLDTITDKNVGKLKLAWSLATGQTEGHQSPPIVNNGYMYVTTPGAQVIALDAASGVELWRYKKELPADLLQLHPTNRGVALYGDKVYLATVDAHLVALDARTGKVAWAQVVGDAKALQYITLAPLAAKGKIMVGSSGGETGVRGFVAAFDAATGKEAWRTYMTAAPGEPGGDTWPGDSHKNGGGSIWITGSYDPATNLAYWGTGNCALAHRRPQGRQPLHHLGGCVGRGQRRHQGPPPVPSKRCLGLGRSLGAGADRHRDQGPQGQGRRPCRPQRLSVAAGAPGGRQDRLH